MSTPVASTIRFLIACLLLVGPSVRSGEPPRQVTILYDVFGQPSEMHKDWGFSALVEYGGRRILFDTGNDAEIFAHNVGVAGVDLKQLDFAVISHRHLDHSAGLTHLLAVNPGVKIYAPMELAGIFGSSITPGFYRTDESLPKHMRYYEGDPPETIALGTPWVHAGFETVLETSEVAPGVHLIALVSDRPGVQELRELSLAIETSSGLLLVVGCSHPGIERIVEAATAIDPRIHVIVGGLHLLTAPDMELSRIATRFRDVVKVRHLAPGHCTGELALASFSKAWGERYLHAGIGEVIPLP